jgi:pimeloyl-ACP methyl ester carboxylesterase
MYFRLGPSLCILLSCAVVLQAAGPAKMEWDSLQIRVGSQASAAGIWAQKKSSKKPMGLMVWMHGGMQGPNCEKGLQAGKALLPWVSGQNVVVASPSACGARNWLSDAGLEAMESLIDSAMKRFPIDRSRIDLVGVSDGGFGVAHYSLKGKRTIARRVLVSTHVGAWIPAQSISEVAPQFSQGSWLFLQGGADKNFPGEATRPWIQAFCAQVPRATLVWEPQGEHDLSWWVKNRPEQLRTAFTAK